MGVTIQAGFRVGVVIIVVALHVCSFAFNTEQDTIASAIALFKAGKAKEAESLLRQASEANPDSTALHGALGELLFNEHNYEGSIQELNITVGTDPGSRKYTILLAEALIATQRFGVAVDLLNSARSRFGDYSQLHYDLGLSYYFMHKVEEAQKEFEEAHRLSPEFDRAELLISACLMAKGDQAGAVDLLRKLVKERPQNAVYWGTLGRNLVKMGDEHKVEAIQAARRALALQPNDMHVQFDAATVFTETGHFSEARPLLETLEKLHPEVPTVHVQLARVYARLGLRELARKENEIVRKLPKQNATDNSVVPVPGNP